VSDPNRILLSLAQSGVALDLKTLDVCYLAALKLRGESASMASFAEDQLVDVFEQVCEVVEPGGEARRRSAHAIRRLREQRLLARIDGAGAVRAGEYALTRLATAIVDFVLEDETLTRESLTVLTRTLQANLSAILADAQRLVGAAGRTSQGSEAVAATDAWAAQVVAPLRVAVGELLGGIQRRQRGFDLQQEQIRRDMASLLQADWFGAIERCEALLEATSATLRELCQVLLRDAHELQGVLQRIQEAAADAGESEAEGVARSVGENIDRLVAWGTARQRAWSEHYQYVHRFLRDVVLLDPTRALTQRLREALAGGAPNAANATKRNAHYALAVAAAPPIQLLREVALPPRERPPVKRRAREADLAVAVEPAEDPQAVFDAEVRSAVALGARGLSAVTERVAAARPAEDRFAVAGRVAASVARVCDARGPAERPWVEIGGPMAVEEWTLRESR
jgi:chromosome partition protein MukF